MRASERELEVLKSLWELGRPASVAEIHEAVVNAGTALAYTTVQTMLNRMASKNLVRRHLQGRAYYYAAVVKAPAAARAALRTLVERFFGGSTVDLAAHLVEQEMSEEDLSRVAKLLSDRKRRRS